MKTKYIALFRGINVAGQNEINLDELKAAYEENGFTNAVCVSSGSMVFDTTMTDDARIKGKCARIIEEKFGHDILVGVLSADELKDMMKHAPAWWDEDPLSKHRALFMIPPMTSEKAFQLGGIINPEYEKISCWGDIIFWSAPMLTLSEARWSRIKNNKKVYDSVIVKKATTVRQLAELTK